MRRLISVIAIALLAFPAFAQDDFGGGFGGDSVLIGGDIDALFGGGGSRGNRGNNNNNNIPNPETLLLQMKDLLKLKKVPLNKDQEKMLKPFIETEVTAMRTDLEAQFGNRGNNNNNNNNNRTATIIADMMTIITKHNTELLTTIKADLTPDQTALIAKAEKDKKVCSVMLDLISPQQVQNRDQQNQGNRGGGRGGGGGGGGGNFQGFEFEFAPPQGNNNRGGNNQQSSFLQQFPDRTYCTNANSKPAERLAPIAAILTKGKKPLTADQEAKFAGLIEAKLPLMTNEMRDKDPQFNQLVNSINNQNNQNRNTNNNNNNNNQTPAVNLQTLRNNIVNTIMTQLGIPTNNNNNNNNNNRGRGNFNQTPNATGADNAQANAAGQPNANAQANAGAQANNANPQQANNNQNNNFNRGNRGNNFNPQQEIQKKNEELLDKIAAKLNPDQGSVVKKYKYDQIKAKGGVERYRAIMEQEGTPLTPEQTTQIQNLFNANNQAVRQYADQLVQAEMAKVTSFELPPLTKEQQQQQNQQQNQNRNPNNVAQNPAAQQIVAKIMPEVSKRHALLDRALTDTIMKVLTPTQVASYKINSI